MTIHQWHERDDDLAAEGSVESLLCAAAAPTEPGPQPGEEAALAAFRATVRSPGRTSMHSLTPVKAALAAAVTGGVLLTGGVAAAATGALPGAAQDTARDMLAHVGVSVPGAAEQSAGHADQRGQADATGGDRAKGGQDQEHAGDPSNGKGAAVSEMAHNTPTGSVEHGATVSGFASGGKSKAGDSGKAGDHSDQSASGRDHQPSTPVKPTPAPSSDHSQDGSGQGSSDGAEAQSSTAGSGHRP